MHQSAAGERREFNPKLLDEKCSKVMRVEIRDNPKILEFALVKQQTITLAKGYFAVTTGQSTAVPWRQGVFHAESAEEVTKKA